MFGEVKIILYVSVEGGVISKHWISQNFIQVAFLQVKSECRKKRRKRHNNGVARILWLEAYTYIYIYISWLEKSFVEELDIGKSFSGPVSLKRLVRLYLQIRNLDVWGARSLSGTAVSCTPCQKPNRQRKRQNEEIILRWRWVLASAWKARPGNRVWARGDFLQSG